MYVATDFRSIHLFFIHLFFQRGSKVDTIVTLTGKSLAKLQNIKRTNENKTNKNNKKKLIRLKTFREKKSVNMKERVVWVKDGK